MQIAKFTNGWMKSQAPEAVVRDLFSVRREVRRLLPASQALLRPPLPRGRAVMRVHATVGGAGLFLLVDIVNTVPGERPSKSLAHEDGPRSSPDARQMATIRP